MVREALEHHAIEADLTCYRDGEQMLRYIGEVEAGQEPCPDIVLLDLNLPRYNGAAVLARMRQAPRTRDIPVVVVTSSKAPTDRDAAFRLGADGYFEKPIDYDEFLRLGAVVRELVRRKEP